MDTFVEIKIEKKPSSEKILENSFKLIKNLEKKLSIFNPESEVSKINKLKKGKVSPVLIEVIKTSFKISEITEGAFDITCKPLIDLYRKSSLKNHLPSPFEIQKTLKKVNWHNVKINGKEIHLLHGAEIDLGGIAKGYIVDKVAEFLKSNGIKNGIVNAGGDIYCFGLNPDGKKWKIGIRDPFDRKKVIEIIKVSDRGIATSGNYERYFKIKNKKLGHIVNPKTGKTVQEFPVSITVIGKTCAEADGLATGFFVLGIKKSIEIANKMKDIEVIIVDRNRKIYTSKNFSNFTLP
ncbi:FAD:protein FMN transferase [bacterium]|nr:FAD:protein FMN transferase [bacterium]